MLNGSGSVVDVDNYYMSATSAIEFRKHNIFCHGTVPSNKKLIPKSVEFNSREYRKLPRGVSRIPVCPEHNMLAVVWLDNREVHFLSTADTTAITTMLRWMKNEKVELPATQVASNYKKFKGGVDKHDKLQPIFSLGKYHQFKKYYVKLWLFLVDIAMANYWIYYSVCPPEKTNKVESREKVFLLIAHDLVFPGYDWATMYKMKTGSRDV
jgi:hypothetical protein